MPKNCTPTPETITGKQVAWNGITFSVPAAWYPAVILKNYLLFEEEYAPVFEIKWQQLKKNFSATSVLNRLTKMLPNTSIAPWKPPEAWINALPQCRAYGFTWKNDKAGGNGLLLYYQQNNWVSLLRFHTYIAGPSATDLNLLGSMQILDESPTIPWMIFDIKARLPREAELQHHEFLTGKYSMVFTLENCRFTLMRFKPAAELLHNQTLAEFGRNLAGTCYPATASSPEAQQWIYEAKGYRRILDLLRRKPTNINMQLTWFKEHNTILGIRVQGTGKGTARLLTSLNPHYLPLTL